MKLNNPVGLGEPVNTGKRSLFRPPTSDLGENKSVKGNKKSISRKNALQTPHRLRTTIELTPQALMISQNIQQAYRLETGRALPLWKYICDLIEQYGKDFRYD